MNTPVFPRMHASLYVANLEATLDFYTRFFGQAPSKVMPHYAKWELAHPGLIISFVENAERVQAGFGHLGIQVDSAEALAAYKARVQGAGLPIVEEVGTACCYAVQDKFWVTDPDGAQWEVYLFHEDAQFNDPRYAHMDASACCMPAAVSTPAATAAAKPRKALRDLQAQPATTCAPGTGCC
jgi:catechol 2,3-dioxygenase-like lactoylglutathione lyase family enzyme